VGAALFHALVLRDGLLRRMFFGRRVLNTNATAAIPNHPLPGV